MASLYEYPPHINENKYPDVTWVKLNQLHKVVLYPIIRTEILKYHELKINIELIEEHLLRILFLLQIHLK